MILSDEQIRQFSLAISPQDIRNYCINNHRDFIKFQSEESKKEDARRGSDKYDSRRTKSKKAMDSLA